MLNASKKLTTQELIDDVKAKSGKATGWPNYFRYLINGNSVTISVDNKILDKKAMRRLDPWGLAFLIDAQSRCGIKINTINFAISGRVDDIKPNRRLHPNLEAFRRRTSFLSINNKDLSFEIKINEEPIELYDAKTLFDRPSTEEISRNYICKAQDNEPGRLEKDFQTWLCPEDNDAKSNVRLAVLGKDFFKLNKKGFGITREFRTGAFHKEPHNNSRILPTEFVDIVTLNKYGQLAVIELKLNDSQLEVISQIMDYSLFFRCYIEKLKPIVEEKIHKTLKSTDIICYVVNNYFHDRFDDVMEYYMPKNGSYRFRIKKVELGGNYSRKKT